MEVEVEVESLNESQIFDGISLILQDDSEFTCARLIENLERNLAILRFEASHVKINSEFDGKLSGFHETSTKLANELDSLQNLSETHFCKKSDLKGFIDQIYSSWLQAHKEGYVQYQKIRVASQTTKGLSLVQLLNKIRKEAVEIKSMLQVCECNCDRQCVPMGFFIHEEISRLIEGLEKCDGEVQLLLSITKLTPHMTDLIKSIDDFINNNEFIPLNRKSSDDLSAFPILCKLLTEELLGYEPMIPEKTLIDNVPRKPVFITKIKKIVKPKVNAPIKITKIERKKSQNF